MATGPILPTIGGTSYTIVTHVIPSSTVLNTDNQNPGQNISTLKQFLKGEPKALGTVQIMIGVLMILFGIVLATNGSTISVYSGIVFWGAIFHISAGSLAVSASNKLNSCAVKGALVMNIFSIISAGVSIILMSLDLAIRNSFRYCRYEYSSYTCSSDFLKNHMGIIGVLLVFSLLQFCISIAVSSFTCKAICTTEPMLNIINVIPNPEGCPPMASSFPIPYHDQVGVNMMHAGAMEGPPAENPPAYCVKSRPD